MRTRRASLGTFAALAATAALLFVVARNGGGGPALGLGILAFGQIAFVAGTLAVWRALRGRTAGDFRVAQRRAAVGLLAGAGVLICVAPLGLAGLPLLAVAAVVTRRAAALTPAEPAEGLAGDFGPHAFLVLLALGIVPVGGVAAQGILFEGSGWEGVIRGAIEAGGLAAGVAILRAPLALRP